MYRTPAVLALLLMVAACGPASTEPARESAAAPASLDTDPAATETDTTSTGTKTTDGDTTSRGGGTIGSGT